jgi:hypothetical protein
MGCVPTPVQGHSRPQLLKAPGESHIFYICPLGWGLRCANGVSKGAIFENILDPLNDHFEDQHLTAFCRSQLKTKTQYVGESLQEFATAVQQRAHRAYPALPEDHVRERQARRSLTG